MLAFATREAHAGGTRPSTGILSQVFATLAAAAKDKAGTAKKKDGQETPEACLILENLGRLLVARGLTQNYPKGTTAQQKAHFEVNATREKDALLVSVQYGDSDAD